MRPTTVSQPPLAPRQNTTSTVNCSGRPLAGFPLRLKVIKEQLTALSHPIRILITEFAKAFIYLNRHLLYTEPLEEKHDFSNL